jgi:hypothetical protein
MKDLHLAYALVISSSTTFQAFDNECGTNQPVPSSMLGMQMTLEICMAQIACRSSPHQGNDLPLRPARGPPHSSNWPLMGNHAQKKLH